MKLPKKRLPVSCEILPERIIKIGAAVIFFGFGVLGMFQGGAKLPYYTWILGLMTVGIMAYFFLHQKTIVKTDSTEEAAAGKLGASE